MRWYFLPHGAVLYLSSPAVWQVWLCPSYNSHYILWTVVQSSEMLQREAPFAHLLPVKDYKNLSDWAMSSHSPQDISKTDFVSWVSLATSTIMFMSCRPCAHMGQLWSVASFYSRQSARENKVSTHCQHSTGAWQSISSLPDRNIFQQHYPWQQLRNVESARGSLFHLPHAVLWTLYRSHPTLMT